MPPGWRRPLRGLLRQSVNLLRKAPALSARHRAPGPRPRDGSAGGRSADPGPVRRAGADAGIGPRAGPTRTPGPGARPRPVPVGAPSGVPAAGPAPSADSEQSRRVVVADRAEPVVPQPEPFQGHELVLVRVGDVRE